MALNFLNNGYFAGKVGIGTESPTRTLQVNSGGANIVATFESSDTLSRISFVDSNTSSDAVVQIGADGNELVLFAGGAEHVRVDSTGNVGIGTTNPSEKLDVVGRVRGERFRTTTGGSASFAAYYFLGDSDTGTFQPTNNTFGITTAGSERMRILANGNVGIGTTSPGAKLHVAYSNSSVYSTTSPSGDLVVSRHNTSNVDNQTVGIRFDTTGFAGTTTGQAAIQAIQPSNLSSADLAFLTRNNATFGERMRITSTGDVGIGTDSPSQKLTVEGNIELGTGGYIYGDTTTSYLRLNTAVGSLLGYSNAYIGLGPSFVYNVGGSEKFRIASSNGNVGIGTTSPGTKLHVNGGIITVNDGTGITYYEGVKINSYDSNGYDIIGREGLTLSTVSADKDIILSPTGNVGIGVTGPNAKLEVSYTNTGIGAIVGNTTHNSQLQIYTAAAGKNSEIWFGDAGDADVGKIDYDHANDSMSFFIGATKRLSFDSAGTMLLGDTTTAYQTIFFDPTPSTVYGNGTLQIQPTTSPGSGVAQFTTNFADRVGGGTTKHNVRVGGTVTATNFIGGSGAYLPLSAGSSYPLTGDLYLGAFNKISGVTNDNLVIGVDINNLSGASSFDIQMDGGTSAFYINNSRQVGIGTTSIANARLKVAGGGVDIESATDSLRLRFYEGAAFKSGIQQVLNIGEMITASAVGDMAIRANAGNMLFATGGSAEKMRITSGGNVGIGTDSPQVRLTLRRENDGSLFELNRPASGVEALYGGIVGNDPYFYSNNGIFTLGINNPDGGLGGEVSYITMRNGTTRYTTFEAGNVGIGVTGPLDKLDVSNGNIRISQTGNVAAQLILNTYQSALGNATYKWFVEQTTSANSYSFQIGNGTTPYLHINSLLFGAAAGNVGIGTNIPGEKLHVNGNALITAALLSNQENTDVDTGTETVASVAIATYTAAFFDFVIKKGLNVRSGTVYACHDGDTTPLVQFTETSTQDLGDTSDVTLSVDISGTVMRLQATTTSDDWSIKSLIRAI